MQKIFMSKICENLNRKIFFSKTLIIRCELHQSAETFVIYLKIYNYKSCEVTPSTVEGH